MPKKKVKNSKKRSMRAGNLDCLNIQPLNNKGLYIRGEDLRALIEKWHNCEGTIKLNEVKDKRDVCLNM